MKRYFNKNLAVLIAGLSIVGTSVFAGELGSLTNEVVLNDYDGGTEKTEWTVAKGSYKINDSFKFLFDIDKDFTTSSGSETEGWDTQFGFSQSAEGFAGWDLTNYYLLRYDASWDVDSAERSSETVQYIFAPNFSKSVEVAGKDVSLTAELWAQAGGDAIDGDMKDISGVEANFYASTSLTDNLSLDLSVYNFNYYDSGEDEYDYQAGTDATLTYSLPLSEGVTFAVENFVEAYYTPDTEAVSVDAHIEPVVKYNKTVNDNFSWHAAVSYEAVNYIYSDSKDSDPSTTRTGNEMEVKIGFKVK